MIKLNDEQLAAIRQGKRVFSWEAMEDVFQVIDDLKRQLAERDIKLDESTEPNASWTKAAFDEYVQEKVAEAVLAESELLKQMAAAMYAVLRRLEFYTKREVNSPSNHQEFAREAQEELDAFNKALSAYNEWKLATNRRAAQHPSGEAPKEHP